MAYNPLSGTWENVKDDPTPRAKVGVAIVDDVLYVIGGLVLVGTDGQKVATAVNEQYVPIGYNGVLPSATASAVPPTSSNSLATSEPEPYKPHSTCLIAVIVVLTVCVIMTALFFHLKKREY